MVRVDGFLSCVCVCVFASEFLCEQTNWSNVQNGRKLTLSPQCEMNRKIEACGLYHIVQQKNRRIQILFDLS